MYSTMLLLTMIVLLCDVCVYQVKIRSPRRQPFVWQFFIPIYPILSHNEMNGGPSIIRNLVPHV